MQSSRFSRVLLGLLSAVTLLGLSLPAPLFADGMMFQPDPYSDRWDYLVEEDQQAFINYGNGLEKMIIGVTFDRGGGDAVWVFPVPADPETVVIDVMSEMPPLRGEEISRTAQSKMHDARDVMWYSQVYPFVPLSFSSPMYSSVPTDGSWGMLAGESIKGGSSLDVNVYDHLEKDGITSEVLTAGSGDDLSEYLSEKGVELEEDSIPVLDTYIGAQYSFVVSWVTSSPGWYYGNYETDGSDEGGGEVGSDEENEGTMEETGEGADEDDEEETGTTDGIDPASSSDSVLGESAEGEEKALVMPEYDDYYDPYQYGYTTSNESRGLFVTFPAEKLYYPLILTSVYDSAVIPMTIRVMGHVTPEIEGYLKEYSSVEYYLDEDVYLSSFLSSEDSAAGFLGEIESGDDITYTKITIEAPSKYLTDDLYMNTTAPLSTYYSLFVVKYPAVIWIVVFLASSVLASIVSGVIVFKDMRSKWGVKKLIVTGLTNVFTVYSVILSTIVMRTKNLSSETEKLIEKLREKGYVKKRRIAMVLFGFLVVPSVFLIVSGYTLFSYLYDCMLGYNYVGYCGAYITFPLIAFVITLFVVLLLMVAVAVLMSVKKEDKPLFEKAKELKLSTTTLLPKDGKKWLYIGLFSGLFLLFSWVFVEIVVVTV